MSNDLIEIYIGVLKSGFTMKNYKMRNNKVSIRNSRTKTVWFILGPIPGDKL